MVNPSHGGGKKYDRFTQRFFAETGGVTAASIREQRALEQRHPLNAVQKSVSRKWHRERTKSRGRDAGIGIPGINPSLGPADLSLSTKSTGVKFLLGLGALYLVGKVIENAQKPPAPCDGSLSQSACTKVGI